MSVLMWDKPERIMSTDEWRSISFDGGPAGGYVPNMSEADRRRYRAKLRYKNTEHPQVEIRVSLHQCQMLIIVGLDGWKHGNRESPAPAFDWRDPNDTRGFQIRMSMNASAWLTEQDWTNLRAAVDEAKAVLESL
jgi:hypothetical protein